MCVLTTAVATTELNANARNGFIPYFSVPFHSDLLRFSFNVFVRYVQSLFGLLLEKLTSKH